MLLKEAILPRRIGECPIGPEEHSARHHSPGGIYASGMFSTGSTLISVGCMPLLGGAFHETPISLLLLTLHLPFLSMT
jgi:hypothetical protein